MFMFYSGGLIVKIKITSDSTCDLSKELLEKYDITLKPLIVVKDGDEFLDGVSITPDDIFEHVSNGGELCSTAAINSLTYSEFFKENLAGYDALIHINIGSGFSSCFQNASIAASELDNVYAVDSQNLSSGQGLVVIEAAMNAKEYDDPQLLVNYLNELTPKIETSFVLSRLEYMVKGGRCSSATALGANLLKLNPCIDVKDGKMIVTKKYRGRYSKCLKDYIKERLEGRDDIRTDKIFLTRTPVSEEEWETAKNSVAEYGSFDNVYETVAGCTVSCHCGPGTLGILFIRK